MLTQVRKTSQLYESHIPTCPIQKTILALGSSFMALMNPFREGLLTFFFFFSFFNNNYFIIFSNRYDRSFE